MVSFIGFMLYTTALALIDIRIAAIEWGNLSFIISALVMGVQPVVKSYLS